MLREVWWRAFRFVAARWYIQFDAMLWAEQTQRQIHDVLFLRLTRDRPTQQLPNLFLQRATMRCSMLLEACMQGRVNIANQQAGHGGLPQLASVC